MVRAVEDRPVSRQASVDASCGARTGAGGGNSVTHAYTMVTHMYTVEASLPRRKCSGIFGFPGLTLTPIPESPETDSLLNAKECKATVTDMWLESETCSKVSDDQRPSKTLKDSILPVQTSPTCAVNVHVVQTTFLPKDDTMTSQERRAHLCKLLLFALCGFVFVAGIILWILSPTFT